MASTEKTEHWQVMQNIDKTQLIWEQ